MNANNEITSNTMFFEQALPQCMLNIGTYGIEMLNWGCMNPHQWHNQRHSHSFIEVCYVWKGKGLYTIEGKDFIVEEDDFLIAMPEEEHSYKADSDDPFGTYCTSIGVYSGKGNKSDSELETLVSSLLETETRTANSPKTLRICELISTEILKRRQGFELCLQGLFTLFFFDLLDAFAQQPLIPSVHFPDRLHPEQLRFRNALTFIANNYHRDIAVNDIASRLCIGPRQANRMFRSITGLPVMKFVQDYRMRVAMQMLISTARPIKEVARACGYPNERSFMTRFRKHTGMTALTYRCQRGKK